MGRVARATLAGGGFVTGIIPSFLVRKEHALTEAQEMLVVENMHERKQAMFDRADAFVALPGGIGTLEELVEQMTWAQLDRHKKPILIADIGGFWRPLLALFAHMNNAGFIRRGFELRYLVAEKIEDVVPMLRAAAEKRAGPEREAASVQQHVTIRGGGCDKRPRAGARPFPVRASGAVLDAPNGETRRPARGLGGVFHDEEIDLDDGARRRGARPA